MKTSVLLDLKEKQISRVCTFLLAMLFANACIANDFAIYTNPHPWTQADAEEDINKLINAIKDKVNLEVFESGQEDALADWVESHTTDGGSTLILTGVTPSTIYPTGNTMPDGSIIEEFLDAGNTILNTGEYAFHRSSNNQKNKAQALPNIIDVPGATMWQHSSGWEGISFAVTPTAEGEKYTPSLKEYDTCYPLHIEQYEGTPWELEIALAINTEEDLRAEPAVIINTETGGRLGVFVMAYTEIPNPGVSFGDVMSEFILNYLVPALDSEVGLSSKPQPEDGALDVLCDVSLAWTPGELADTHTVFFGTAAENVDNASPADPMGVLASQGQIATTYDPPGRLDFGQTYYWRVDEVNAAPDYTVFKGDLWSFTTEPVGYQIENIAVTASSEVRANEGPENTINGSGLDDDDLHSAENSDMWLSNVADADGTWIQYEFDKTYKLYQMLVWNYSSSVEPVVGFGIKEAAIEYSTDGINWATLGATHEFARGIGSAGYAANTTVDLAGVAAKYVKITANSNWGGMVNQYGLSEVRFLYIPVWAREPNPTPGAADVSVDTVLDWRAGREAAGHDVYLSTDEQAVIDGTAPVVTVTEPSYASSLDLAANYYWRIDEVNDAETPAAWPGDVWNFSTQEYIVVDDFESYNDIPVGEEGSNLVYMAWIDGFDNPSANGSTMGYVTGASLETGNVHAGGKSVPLAYDNTTAGISEVVRSFTPAQDWSAHGVKTLSLWFAGDGANVAGQLYVKVNGVQVNYDGDAANLTVTGWQPWNVDLTAINTNLSNVTSMTIGIQGPGATGTLLLDDIRLYSYDRELITPAEPGAAGLQAHYEFEGNTNDSSGNACHGTAAGNPFFGEGKIGQAMSFDGLDDVVEVPHSAGIGFNDSTNLTVTLWAKPIKLPRLSWTGIITKNRDIGGSAVYGIWINNSNQWHFHVGGRKGNANIPGAPEPTEEWHFVAMTHDVDATTLRGYVDGLMIYENTNSDPAPLTAQSPLWIGGSQSVTEFYPGQLDDVRIYDRTLTQEEIAWLAGRTQPFDKPF